MAQDRQKMTYKDAGVDIEAATESLRSVKEGLVSTFNDRVLSDLRSFGSLYDVTGLGGERPTLVASADGVGTKLKVAAMANRHDTVGLDLVNHCVNDIAVQGARPLFFMDYFATGRLEPGVFQAVLQGFVRGCRENRVALIGGETAEMPDFYGPGEYDLAGFIVGVVDRKDVVDGSRIAAGDILVGLPSSGLHTNGYSLARKALFGRESFTLDSCPPEVGRPLGEALLEPHLSYLKGIEAVREAAPIHGMVHVTGGGFKDNIPRVLPAGLSARIDLGSWDVPGIFRLLVDVAGLDQEEAFRTFNMGIGFIFVLPPACVAAAVERLKAAAFAPVVLGGVEPGDGGVRLG